MIHLTSDLDFKLTKKRFLMMGRNSSRIRSAMVSFVTLPVLIFLTLTFCTEEPVPEDAIYSDIELISKKIHDNLPYNSANSIYYGPDGISYTGEQNWYYSKTGILHRKHVFYEGQEVQVDLFDPDGSQISRFETSWSIGDSGVKVSSIYRTDNGMEPVLDWEYISFDSVTVVKKYYPDKQVEFEYAYETTHGEYDGLMASYDKDGNILAMERYDMGEMVEKVK